MMRKKFSVLLLLLVLILPAVFNLILPGFYESDDGEWMIIRFTSFYEELRQGQFPVRFLNRLNNGYGYPVATFLYPGFMYIASIVKFIGFSFIMSVKLVFVGSVVAGFIGSFYWLKNHFSVRAAVVGAAMYIYHPYLLWDIYKRGSVGEVLALGIFPLLLNFIDRNLWFYASIVGAFIIVSHNTLALFLFPISVVYFIIVLHKIKTLRKTLTLTGLYVLFSLGLSAFFWIPAITELPLTVFRNTSVSEWDNYFVTNIYLIGIVPLIIALLTIWIVLKSKTTISYHLAAMFTLLAAGVFFATSLSAPFWNDEFLGRLVQFPFRFLSLVIVASSFIIAYVFHIYALQKRHIVWTGIIIAIIMMSRAYFATPAARKDVIDSYYSTNEATTTVQNEYMPTWVKTTPASHADGRLERTNFETIQVNTIYWPGHEVFVNGRQTNIDYSNEYGLIRIGATANLSEVEIRFNETPVRTIANITSIVSFIVLLFMYFKRFYA